jgi:predicted nucleic acid binding AN1-type Zn finger protein
MSGSIYYRTILLHSSAHLRHACAHSLQCSICPACFSHSCAHASHTSAHRLQNCFANWLSIDISAADVQQTSAHSLQSWTQVATILTSSSLRHPVAQNSQASAHLMQASMQLCHFVFWSVPAVDISWYVCALSYLVEIKSSNRIIDGQKLHCSLSTSDCCVFEHVPDQQTRSNSYICAR